MTVHAHYQLTRLSDTISHGGTKKPPRNRNRGSSLAGRPRDTMLIGQTYAKDAGRSCSDLPNYCDYAPRFRAEERGLLRGRKPKLLRSRFIQPPLNQICCSAVAKLLGRGKRLLKDAMRSPRFVGANRKRGWMRMRRWKSRILPTTRKLPSRRKTGAPSSASV